MKFVHSGNIGDVIFSLSTVLCFSERDNVPADIILVVNHPAQYASGMKHPMGDVYLNQKTAEMFVPLLGSQKYIGSVSIKDFSDYANIINAPNTINLDLFRRGVPNFHAGCISRWYFPIFNVYYPVWQPWMTIPRNEKFSEKMVFARSVRNHSPINPPLNFNFLKHYVDKICFIGLDDEYKYFLECGAPLCEYVKVKDFLEMGTIIASAPFFYGNASFPLSIAEAVKTPRLVEICQNHTNIPQGGECYDFYSQQTLENIVVSKLHG